MFVDTIAESDGAADGDSEEFGEAAEAQVVAFAVFRGGRFVVGSCWGLVGVAQAGALRKSASMCDLALALG